MEAFPTLDSSGFAPELGLSCSPLKPAIMHMAMLKLIIKTIKMWI